MNQIIMFKKTGMINDHIFRKCASNDGVGGKHCDRFRFRFPELQPMTRHIDYSRKFIELYAHCLRCRQPVFSQQSLRFRFSFPPLGAACRVNLLQCSETSIVGLAHSRRGRRYFNVPLETAGY